MRPIAERKLLSTADRRAIFSNIEALSGCAAVLLEELSEEGDPVRVLVAAFLKVAPFLKLYGQFSADFDASAAALQRCRKQHASFDTWVEKQGHVEAACHGLPLEAFLIKPIQRITKYPLFFKQACIFLIASGCF